MNYITARQLVELIYRTGPDQLVEHQDWEGNTILSLGRHRLVVGDEVDGEGNVVGWSWTGYEVTVSDDGAWCWEQNWDTDGAVNDGSPECVAGARSSIQYWVDSHASEGATS